MIERNLVGKTAVVTGAARGFGRETALLLAEAGARVAIWDIDEQGAQAVADRISDSSQDAAALAIRVDVADPAAVDTAAVRTAGTLGVVDVLVNNAALVDAAMPWEVSDESWGRTMAVNANGAFHCVRACLPGMREQRYGKIVNIGSIAAQQGRPASNPAYAASKGAILGLTVSLARNLGEYGICVNAINPGFIRTEIHDAFSDNQISTLTADIPLHRHGVNGAHGRPEDIAHAVRFLASPRSDYISGEFLNVNGASRTG